VDALGNPLRLILSGGNVVDLTQGLALVEAIATDAVVADKGYDSDAFVDIISATGAEAVIPPRSNRLKLRTYDKARYKARNLVERCFTIASNNFVASPLATISSLIASMLS
jgi:transposase